MKINKKIIPKVSIIVPVYNVEKYVAKCLDSLVAQDYKNYDVIVVNDGSPFNEQKIIDKYKKKYPKKIKSIVKENGGYGSVLELAIKESDADYILVCDPDDYLEFDAVSTLVKYQQETNTDLVVGAKYLVYSDNEEVKYDKSFNSEFGQLKDKQVYKKGTKEYEMLYFLEPSPHAKLYKRDIVKKIKFPHKVSYTDNLLYFYTLTKVKSVTYCEKALSFYLINREGNTRTDLKPTIIDAWVTVFNNILNQVKKADDIFYYRMFEAFYSVYYKIDNISLSKEEKIAKYDLVYSIIEKLIPYKEQILSVNNRYQNDSRKILKQKEALLTKDSSKKMFDKLVHDRLYGSLKSKVKKFIQTNDAFSKIYGIYHFHAKYYKTRNDEKIELNKDVKCAALFNDEYTHFFGYYDKPCVYDGKVLSHRVNSNSLSYDQKVDILVDNKKVSESSSWNWQQGSMSTWIDSKHIIHNDFDGKKYISKIVNAEKLDSKIIDFPIYSLSKNKKFALSLNFSRLAKLRKDYGYYNLPYNELPDDRDDGIYYVDIINNKHYLYLSLEEIKSFLPKVSMAGAIHKVNHIDISPDSKKAMFLHRWFVGKTKYTRLLLLDIASKKLTVLADNDMVSHMAWVDNKTVFGFLKGNNNKDGFFFIDLKGNQKQVEHPLLIDDGHPTVLNKKYIIVDSYPDYTCKSKLMLIDTEKNEVNIIGRFYSGKKYQNDLRCDLHPRFDYKDNKLTIDSVCNGKRNIFQISIEELLSKQGNY